MSQWHVRAGLVALLIGAHNALQAAELPTQTVIWQGSPLSVAIAPGQYRLLTFAHPVRVDVPIEIADQLSVDITRPGHVLLKAHRAFTAAPLRIARTDGAWVMPLLLSARPGAPRHTLAIRDARQGVDRPVDAADTSQAPPYVALLRHAAQTLYAPRRLIPTSTRLARIATGPTPLPANLLRSQRGEHYHTDWLATWSGAGHWISAIVIRNATPLRVRLDPRNVRLPHLAAVSFQHTWLAPQGDLRDETVLYLITRVHPKTVFNP